MPDRAVVDETMDTCPECKSDLTVPTIWWRNTKEVDMACHACGHEWTPERAMDFKPVVREFTTLLACMSVDGGPEGCCGCFNAIERGGDIWNIGELAFYCNECSRVVFSATPRKARMVEK